MNVAGVKPIATFTYLFGKPEIQKTQALFWPFPKNPGWVIPALLAFNNDIQSHAGFIMAGVVAGELQVRASRASWEGIVKRSGMAGENIVDIGQGNMVHVVHGHAVEFAQRKRCDYKLMNSMSGIANNKVVAQPGGECFERRTDVKIILCNLYLPAIGVDFRAGMNCFTADALAGCEQRYEESKQEACH